MAHRRKSKKQVLERIKAHRWEGSSLLGKDLLTDDDKKKLQGYI